MILCFTSSLAPLMVKIMQCCGIGYDVHPFAKGRKLFLGGIEIEHEVGLEGHSDADALLHAIADALLGAIGGNDIGFHFPNTDARWKDVRSTIFLEEIAKMISEKGGKICNVDATVVAEAPKLLPHVGKMKEAISKALGIKMERVNLKATTNEKMGFIGRKEGIAAMAVASVEIPD